MSDGYSRTQKTGKKCKRIRRERIAEERRLEKDEATKYVAQGRENIYLIHKMLEKTEKKKLISVKISYFKR